MQFLLRLVILCAVLTRVASRRYADQPHRHGTRSIDVAESDKLVIEEGKEVQYNSYSKHHTGRHICSKSDNRPLKTKQAYCKPIYKNYVVRCQGNQVCQGVRLVYETHYKEIPLQTSNEVILACCPGWAQVNNRSHGCNKPVCSKPCLNGGKCVKPELCGCLKGFSGQQCEIVISIPECSKSCLNGGRCISTDLCSCPEEFGGSQCETNLQTPKCGKGCENGGSCLQQEVCLCLKGYMGRYCEADINECKEQKPCDQICHNTFGSYYCQCKEDFILLSDGQSCRKETDEGGIEAKDLEFEMLDKRLHKLETMMSKSHDNDVSKNDLENVYKDMNYISKDLSNIKNKISEVENYKYDMNLFKTKLNSIEKKADQVDDLLMKYDRIKACAFYNKICL